MNLKFLSTFFKRKENIEEVSVISSLAPKVLTSEEDLKKVEPYLDKLKDTLNSKGINNIALTGGYGSGKSTILKTFQYWNKNDYNFLNISLAAFNQTKTKENFKELFDLKIKNGKSEKEAEKEIVNEFKETIINNEELERQLEISILQQIVYKVKPSNLPESRFKRIINIPNWKLWGLIPLSFIVWIGSIILLFKYDFLDYINPKTWTFRMREFELSPFLIFLIAFLGIGYFSKLVVELFTNSTINKVNLKGEIEIGEKSNKSILNEHYDEILYYFEKNPFNVVVIEDLDRFENTNIFTKLRELNILLNNADTLKNKEEYKKFGIKFLYAVGDDLFDDKKERVKFFEYIIPVIPFINSTNAEEQLKTLIKESDLEGNIFTNEFISDITTFIDDIDMRLLVNIFHEFVIYRNVLGPYIIKGSEAELFAMITYKNIDPEDFNKLNNKEGKLYNLINNKKSYITKLVKEKADLITEKNNEIENLEKENINNLEELKSIYLFKIFKEIPIADTMYINSQQREIGELLENSLFEEIRKTKNFKYYRNNYGFENSNLSFEDIENEVNPDYTFEERKSLIENKRNDRVEILKKGIEKLKKEKNEIENWDLTQIFREVDINQYLSEFSNNGLLRNLVLEGYINENYNDYISLFHEVSLTVDDKKFEKSVKASFNESFEYKLTHRETIADKLELKWFSRDSILNFDLLDFLGDEYYKYSQKYDAFIQLLSNEKQRSIEFIDGYIERKNVLNRFIEKITIKWGGFWEYVFNKSTYDDNKKYYIFEIIILNLNLEKLIEVQSGRLIKKTIEDNIQYLYNYDKNSGSFYFEAQIERLFLMLNIKIIKLEKPIENVKYLFELIYKKGNYKITNENILLLLNEFSEEFDNLSFETSNYSAIQHSKCEPLIKYINEEIDTYIENVYLKLENNVIEDEESLKLLLNNDKLDSKLKLKIIEKVETKISDLSSINDIEVKKHLLIENKVVPKWDNVISYYKESENKIDDSLVKYLNFENVNSTLSKNKLVRENKDFEISLMLCNELTDVNYDKFLNSCYFGWNKLNFEDVDFNKVVFLTNKVLNTTKDNYDILRENFKNNHIKLLEKNFTEILVKFEDFEVDGNDILLILKSEKINIVNKFDFITKIDETIIGSNKEIAKIIGEIILQKSKTIDLTIDIKKIILNSLVSIESKVKFVTLYNESLGTSELIELVKNISWSYGELFKKQHKPTFKANNYNNVLLGILKSKGLIKNFDIDKKDKTLIRAVANY
jgi:dephospho-CoA kinase